MNAQIARLEELLTRIQKNRQAPRAPLAGAASQASGQVAAPEAAPAVDQAPARESVVPDSLDAPPPESGTERLEASLVPSSDLEAPITPPPESGRERSAAERGRRDGPTMEQLGQTVPLEEGTGAVRVLDLDEPLGSDRPAPASERLEMSLPSAMLGSYEENLMAPPEAKADLERVLRSGGTGELVVQAVARPRLSTNVVELIAAQKTFRPSSFVELIDSSLTL